MLQAALKCVVVLMLLLSFAMAQPVARTSGGGPPITVAPDPAQASPLLVPNARVSVTTVDLATFVGDLVSATAEGVELRLTEGKQSGELIRVPLRDLRKVKASQGKGSRDWSAVRGALPGAALVAPVAWYPRVGNREAGIRVLASRAHRGVPA